MEFYRTVEIKTCNEGQIMRAVEFVTEGKKHRRDKRHTIKPRGAESHEDSTNKTESKDVRHLKIDADKPRNFVAKNAKMGGAGQHKDKKKAEKQGDFKHKKDKMSMEDTLGELSNDLLGRYKKAAGADASAADKEGDYERGNKRFSGIVKATNKQFNNDAKKNK